MVARSMKAYCAMAAAQTWSDGSQGHAADVGAAVIPTGFCSTWSISRSADHLTEAGCSPHEITSITRHKTLAEAGRSGFRTGASGSSRPISLKKSLSVNLDRKTGNVCARGRLSSKQYFAI
jgi:hypothetical protein